MAKFHHKLTDSFMMLCNTLYTVQEPVT